MRLALFDLDHTLLQGDSDVLWCAFLLRRGLLPADFEAGNRAMEAAYQAGTVGVREFCDFYVSTLAGRTPAELQPLREEFLATEVAPRIPRAAHALVRRHAADLCVLTTATNRVITELTAAHLGIAHLIATEVEFADGRCTGRTTGTPNMRDGKVERLHAWLAERGLQLAALDSVAYSDSINDLPLLAAAGRAVAVNPDARLAAAAAARGWPVMHLRD